MFKKALLLSTIVIIFFLSLKLVPFETNSGAPPYGIPESEVPDDPVYKYRNWTRPDVPPKVGLQVGHWKNEELPEELSKLHGNTGAQGGGKSEWEVNYVIAENMAKILEENGIEVDILPSTVPPEYWSDVFLAIHADGSTNTSKSGFKFAAPWRDLTNDSSTLVKLLEERYGRYTDLEKDPNITRNMRGYYAFAWWRYTHSIHPMTTAAIAETGFLTNYSDRQLIINTPEIPARAMSEAILIYLNSKELITYTATE